MSIGYIELPLFKDGDFALIPYDATEREMLGEDEFLDLLDKKIMWHLAELTNRAIKEEE